MKGELVKITHYNTRCLIQFGIALFHWSIMSTLYTIYPVTSKSCIELSFDRKVIGKIMISIRCVF